MYKDKTVYAIVLAAGKGTRIGFDKMMYKLDRLTVAEHSIKAFCDNEYVDRVVVAAGENFDRLAQLAIKNPKVKAVIHGGSTRAQSVLNALEKVPEDRIVAIHDGARPFVSQKIISDAIESAYIHKAAIPCVKVKDTIKQSDGQFIDRTFERDKLYIVQTPQVFCINLYRELVEKYFDETITDDAQLFALLTELTKAKQEYDKIADALSSVKATGYGVVMPSAEEMTLQTPEPVRKGGNFGVKLRAGAPSIHMIRVDIDTEISPMVGDEQQSRDLVDYLTGEDPEKLWQSNIFGKSVYDLVQEGLTGKLIRTPDDVRAKFRGCLTRVVNEGATGLICLIL